MKIEMNGMVFEANTMEEIQGMMQSYKDIFGTSKAKAPKKGTGAKAPKASKKSDEPKEFKNSYTRFEAKGNGWKAESVASKNGNPDACIHIDFDGKPDAKTLRMLKAFGFKWSPNGAYWYNVNNDDAKELFTFIK